MRAALLLAACVSCSQSGFPPFPVSGARAQGSVGAIRLDWTPGPYSVSTRVERARSITGPFETVGSAQDSFLDRQVGAGESWAYRLTPLGAGGAPGQSSTVMGWGAPETPSGLAVTPGSASVQLSWAPTTGAEAYEVFGGRRGGSLELLAKVASPRLSAVVPPGARSFAVQALLHGGRSAPSATIDADVPSLTLTGSATKDSITLHWLPVFGAPFHQVGCGTFGGLSSALLGPSVSAVTFPGLPGNQSLTCRVTAYVSNGPSVTSPEITLVTVDPVATPATTASVILTPGILGVQVGWNAPYRTIGFRIYRAAGSDPLRPLATIPAGGGGNPYLDTDVIPWQHYTYLVQALEGDRGVPIDPFSAAPVQVLGPPDVQNDLLAGAGPFDFSSQRGASQTFVAHQSGLLQGIEVVSSSESLQASGLLELFVGPVRLASASASARVQSAVPFDPRRVAAYHDLRGAGIHVVAGEALRFDYRFNPGYFGQLWLGGSFAEGSLLENGIPRPGRSLAFRTFIEPDPAGASGPPSGVAVLSWAGQQTLAWGAAPGAPRHRVYRADAAGPLALQAEVTAPLFVDHAPTRVQVSYRFIALRNGVESEAASYSASFAEDLADVENRGDLATAVAVHAPASQTFTVGRTGILTGLEFSAAPSASTYDALTYELYDPAGKRQAVGFPVRTADCCTAPPLQAGVPGSNVVSGLYLPVVAGQQWRLSISGSASWTLGAGPDQLAGGNAIVGGVAQPGTDLWIRTLVR